MNGAAPGIRVGHPALLAVRAAQSHSGGSTAAVTTTQSYGSLSTHLVLSEDSIQRWRRQIGCVLGGVDDRLPTPALQQPDCDPDAH